MQPQLTLQKGGWEISPPPSTHQHRGNLTLYLRSRHLTTNPREVATTAQAPPTARNINTEDLVPGFTETGEIVLAATVAVASVAIIDGLQGWFSGRFSCGEG